MGNRFKTKTKWFAGSLLLLSPALVAAAGLGKLSVLSALGQPLKVEIDVVALQKGESDSLNARIASADAFRQAGVEYGAVIPQIRAAVEHRNDGRAIISLKSQQPIDEPFVDVLVELNSASGRLVRQYTFLLDPVGYKGPEPIVATPSTVAQPQAAPTQPAPLATPIETAPAAAATAKPASPTASAPTPAPIAAETTPAKSADTTNYKVRQGDTLTEIALAHKPQDVSLQQMLVALHRANEDAFIKKNMNLVRVGKILRIPDAATVSQVEQSEAVRVVNTQTREFAAYRTQLAEAVAAAPEASQAGQQQASGRITTQVEDKPATAAPTDELRLSKATEGKGAAAAGVATADDVAAREQALSEANTRVADLERNLNDLQKLLELKNQQLAQLQNQAQPQAAAPASPTPQAEAATDAAAPAAEVPVATPSSAEANVQAPAADQVKEPTGEAATPVAKPEPKAKAKPAAKPAPAPQPEPSFVDTLLEDPMLLAGGGGAVIALLLGLLVWRRKRSASLDNSLIGMTTTDSSSVFGTTGGRNVDTGASGLQTDFSQSAIGSIDTEEVDPVAEADVYMAYGRDAQAEEILKEALQKDPSRQAVRVKLLEIYASRKDLKAFETTASEIYTATGGQGSDWDKAVSLGRSIDPSNPMYGAPQAVAAAPAANIAAEPAHESMVEKTEAPHAAPLLDLDLDSGAAVQPATPDIAFESNVSQALDLDLDLNLGSEPSTPATTEEPADFSPSGTFIMDAETKKAVSELGESQSLDIDLGAPTLEPRDAKSNLGLAMDFKLDEPTIEQPKADVPAVDLSGLSLDLNEGSGQGTDSSWQEVATKLDLAKAYEEMGDKDGARELLNEVLKEGDNAQQEQARTMLAAIR
ncbi:MAG TPA: FimV/HubP family polar landmark protein [Burkholderiales bacterium]